MLILALLLGRRTGLYDPGGRTFPELQDCRLSVAGTVTGKEAYAGGCRVILQACSFLTDENTSYQSPIHLLNQRLHSSDKILIWLSGGPSAGTDLYGNVLPEPVFHSSAVYSEDQTGLFKQLHIGDTVIFRGKCSDIEAPTNPGQFDLRTYYHARNIYVTMRQVQMEEHARRRVCFMTPIYLFRDLLCNLRYRIQTVLSLLLGPEDASLLAAALLGDKSGLSEERKMLLRDGGASFLLAVSGLHISLAGRSVYRLLRRLRRSFLCASLCSLFLVLTYLLMAGGCVSAQRACIMFALWLGAQVLGRRMDTPSALGAAILLILVRQPCALFDSSFQISCICILSVEFIAPQLERIFRAEALCAALSIEIGTIPVVLYWYYQMTPYAAVLYPLFSRMASVLLACALPALLLASVSLLLPGKLLAGACKALLSGILLICRIEQALPYSTLVTGRPDPWKIIVYYGLLAAFVVWAGRMDKRAMKAHAVRIRGLCLAGALSMGVLMSVRKRPAFRYTCLDIGQGSCNLIECGAHAFVFDAGSSSVTDVWAYRIRPTLKYYGISQVDAVILSHADQDHVNALEEMLDVYQPNLAGKNAQDVTIGQILLPDLPYEDERLETIAERADRVRIPVGYASEGASIACGDLQMQVLSPSLKDITQDANQDSLVLQAVYGDLTILMSGDLELEGEERFCERYRNGLPGTPGDDSVIPDTFCILVAGHHGSKNATSERMLEIVQPDLVLISCGKNNRYGHPAGAMLSRLRAYGTGWKRTDLEGAQSVVIP